MVIKQVINNSKIYNIPHNKSFNPNNLFDGVFTVINQIPHNKSINTQNLINGKWRVSPYGDHVIFT